MFLVNKNYKEKVYTKACFALCTNINTFKCVHTVRTFILKVLTS